MLSSSSWRLEVIRGYKKRTKREKLIEAKERPQTTAKDKGDHHSTTLPPIPISLDMRSTPKPIAKGNRPTTVVAVVKIIGLKR